MDTRSFTFGGCEAAIFHAVVDGLRTYWIERDGPYRAVLVFCIGQADEPLPKRGICHLIEHLAIAPEQRLYAYNGWSSIDETGFWAEGTREEALGYLAGVARNLRELPADRFDAERRILTTEGQNRGNSMAAVLLSSRCGAVGYGAPSWDEYGLHRLTPGEAQDWTNRHFVAENAVLYLSGPPPDGFSLGLERGEPHPLPATTTIAGLELPTSIQAGQGAVGAGMMVTRGPATGLALGTLAATATQRLRYELGHSYNIWSNYQIAGASEAHLTVAADCIDANAAPVIAAFIQVVDEMAEKGPDEASLAREVERFRRALQEPIEALQWIAAGSLVGITLEQLEEQYRTLPAVGPADVAAIIGEGARRMIMLVPNGATAPPHRFRPFPHYQERAVEGRMVRPSGLRRWLGARNSGVVLGEEGLSAVYPDRTITTIPWETCELVLEFPDGTTAVIGRDGDQIAAPPNVFRASDLARVRETVRQQVPGDLIIRIG